MIERDGGNRPRQFVYLTNASSLFRPSGVVANDDRGAAPQQPPATAVDIENFLNDPIALMTFGYRDQGLGYQLPPEPPPVALEDKLHPVGHSLDTENIFEDANLKFYGFRSPWYETRET